MVREELPKPKLVVWMGSSHAFQKKSKRGIATPKPDMDLIRRRLADATRLHEQRRK